MFGGVILIRDGELVERIEIPDFRTLTLENVTKCAEERRCRDEDAIFEHPFGILLFDKPDASTPLNEAGFRRLINSLITSTGTDHADVVDNATTKSIELYLRDQMEYFAEGDGSSMDVSQYFELPPCPSFEEQYRSNSDNSFQVSETNENESERTEVIWPPAHPEILTGNLLANGESENKVHQWITNVRKYQKRQYRSDIFPSKRQRKRKNAKKNERPTNGQSSSQLPKNGPRKHPLHLQGVKPQNRSRVYPVLKMPTSYCTSMENKEKVVAYIAAVKYIHGRPYLDPLKGFLVNKSDPKIPLENPFKMQLDWKLRNILTPEHYALKLVLLQVAGDVNRRLTTEFKEGFDFNHREVDEISKSLGDDEDDDGQYLDDDEDDVSQYTDDQDDEYQLAVVLAKGDPVLEGDWLTLVISDEMSKTIYKPQKTTTA